MNSALWSIHNSKFLYFVVLLIVILGVTAYWQVGRLEDPEFTVKTAIVFTYYPGATAKQVEQEVTDKIEIKLQQMGEIKKIESRSSEGFSLIKAEIKDKYPTRALKQIWDQLRKKVIQAQPELPDSVLGPFVNDEFGDVYGIMLAVTGDGFTYAELEEHVKDIRLELLHVPEVAKVEMYGVQNERIFLEITRAKLAELGISPLQIAQTIQQQNVVMTSGSLEVGDQKIQVTATGSFQSMDELVNVTFRSPVSGTLVYLRDLAAVQRAYIDPPEKMVRYNNQPALALGIVATEKANIVRLGDAIHKKVEEIKTTLPVGIEFGEIAFQPTDISKSIHEFIKSLYEAIIIVIVLLLFTLGPRMGLIVGIGAPITICITFIAMWLSGIDLQRVSLGALIIALGVLVDDSIVICELIAAKLEQGANRLDAACAAVKEVGMPLFYGTVIACLSFSPISLSNTSTGEYCKSIFQVVSIALMASWFQAMTFTTLNGFQWAKIPAHTDRDPFGGPIYRLYRRLLYFLLRRRVFTLVSAVLLLIAAGVGFTHVRQIFFPPADRLQFMIDYWRPEGTRIEAVSDDVAKLEQFILEQNNVANVTSFIGDGFPRFYLPMIPAEPDSSFAQLLVNIKQYDQLEETMQTIEEFLQENVPDAEPRVYEFQYGEPVRYPLELRISGKNEAILRQVAERTVGILRQTAHIENVRQDWRQRVPRALVRIDQEKCRQAGLSTAVIAENLSTVSAEAPLGVYREKDKRIPIFSRIPDVERNDFSKLNTLMIWPPQSLTPIPLRQVADIQMQWEDSLIWRRNRERTITVQGDVQRGYTASEVMTELMPKIANLSLPQGVRLEWGGVYETANKSQKDVLSIAPLAVGLMVLILVWQFKSYRRPLIILITVPMAGIGITCGMLLFGQPFGFMALLGAMSLVGVIIRNTIVLVDEIDAQMKTCSSPVQSVINAGISRLRPVFLAAAATVMGMIPLAFSGPFWAPMAITIMFGLMFATLLTLGLVPVLYTLFFRISIPKKSETTL